MKTIISLIIACLITAQANNAYSATLTSIVGYSGPSVTLRNGVTWLLPASATYGIPKVGRAVAGKVIRNGLARVNPYVAIGVAGYLSYSELRAKAEADPARYPNLYQASRVQEYAPGLSTYTADSIGLNKTQMDVGGVFIYNGYVGVISNKTVYNGSQPYVWSPYYRLNGQTPSSLPSGTKITTICTYELPIGSCPNATGYCGFDRVNVYEIKYDNVPAPTYRPTTDTEFETAISTPSLDELLPVYQNEVDSMIQSNPDIVETDSDIATQVANANSQYYKDIASQKKQATVDALRAALDTAQANYDANPTPENKQKLDDAKAALAKEQADQASDDAQESSNSFSADPPSEPEKKSISFKPMEDLGRGISEKFPFSLLVTIKNLAQGFVATPRAPEFTISFPAPFNYDWRISLERFDGIATMIRYILSVTILCASIMAVIRRWS